MSLETEVSWGLKSWLLPVGKVNKFFKEFLTTMGNKKHSYPIHFP